MTEKRLVPMVAAVLAVLLLAGCGISTESNVDSTTPEGLQTFGVAANPSAEPSKAQEVTPAVSGNGENTNGQPGQTDEGENGGPNGENGNNQGGTAGGNSSPAPTSTSKPTSKPNPTPTTSPANSPASSPAITPPAPASSATYDDVSKYVGKQLTELVAELGYPVRSDYEYVDDEDPTQGEIGTLYFSGGFTVTTRRDDSGEIITAITPGSIEQVTPDHS